ncbi:MAG: c-type cytochrome [Phycisphaerales bacterium]|nr:c-type cytochrome [Phycisphaerales bacterium]
MPVSEKNLYNISRLNVLFAVSSGLLLASMLWLAVVDYDQQWRPFQDSYMDVQGVLAELDYLFTQRDSEQEKLRQAQQRLEEARQLTEQSRATIEQHEAKLHELDADYADIKLRFGPVDNVHQVTLQSYEHALAAHGSEHPETRELAEQKEREEEQIAELGVEKQRLEDEIEALKREVKKLRAPQIEAQKAYDALVRQAKDAENKADWYGGKLRRTAFNVPMLDFLATKNTPGRQEIKQLVLPDIRSELNYLRSYTTDRCVTCHIAIDNRDFTEASLAARFERGLGSINEQRAKLGRAPIALPQVPALTGEGAPKLEAGKVTDHWEALTAADRKAYFDALLGGLNQYQREEGKPQLVLTRAMLAHPNLDLYVQIDSPHPMKTMGCTVCHEGNPQETTFVLAAHNPVDHAQEKEWEEKYYVNNAGVPTATFELLDHYWDRHMLPTRYTEGNCVKCHQQPSGIGSFNLQQQGSKVRRGFDLFTRVGCVNCHLVKGFENAPRVGPSLAHIESKLERGFTEQWIYNPKAFRPSTWMPHFFMQENNGPGSESEWDADPTLRTEVEVSAMAHYLFAVSQPWKDMEPMPDGVAGDAQKGRELFKSVGCLACHANLAEFGESWIVRDRKEHGETPEQAKANFDAMSYSQRSRYAMDHLPGDRDAMFSPQDVRFDPAKAYNKPVFTRVGPELSGMGSKTTPQWIYAWLRNPSSYHADTRMPSLRLTPQEAADVAAYLSGLKLDPARDAFKGEAFPLDERHRQLADKLVFDLIASQRSEARTRLMMDDADGELTKTLQGFPGKSGVNETYASRVSGMSLEDKRLLYLGNKSISHYGCYACHLIPGFETAVRPGTELTVWSEKPLSQLDFAFFSPSFAEARQEEANKPVFEKLYPPHRPDLVALHHGLNPPEEITHDHAAFAYHKVLNPRIWDRQKEKKPLDKLKMPNFYFTEEEAEALVTFMMGRRQPRVSSSLVVNFENDPRDRIAGGRDLTRWFNCVGCHPIEDNYPIVQQYYRVKEAGKEKFDEVNSPPPLRGQGAKTQPAWFYSFVNNVEMLRPWLKIRMPSFHLTGDDTRAIVEHFTGLANDEARQLTQRLKPVDEYRATQQAQARPGEGTATHGAIPAGDDWFAQDNLRKAAGFLGKYSIVNRLMMPFQLNPAENSPEDLAENYARVHTETTFLRDLYAVRYPFDDVMPTTVDEERFKTGEEMVLTLGCLKCHVLGDPKKEGANANPSAPNLNLTARRLRQEWVRSWVKAPAAIQPGTKMPQLWPNMQSAFSNFGDKREELEAKFGRTAEEQIRLLVDYLVAAGLRNHTAVDPNVKSVPAGGAEGGDFIDEDAAPAEEFIEDE